MGYKFAYTTFYKLPKDLPGKDLCPARIYVQGLSADVLMLHYSVEVKLSVVVNADQCMLLGDFCYRTA